MNEFVSRSSKKVIFILLDVAFLYCSIMLSFCVAEVCLTADYSVQVLLFALVFLSAMLFFISFGMYRMVVRYFNIRSVFYITNIVILYSIALYVAIYLFSDIDPSVGVLFVNVVTSIFFVIGWRVVGYWFINKDKSFGALSKSRSVIYGAGEAGHQLAIALSNSPNHALCAFVDDSKNLQGQILMGVPILSFEQLSDFISRNDVTDLLLAMPSISSGKRKGIINKIQPLSVHVKTLPGLLDLADGKASFGDLHDLDVEDLLLRDPALPDESLLRENVSGHVVMVTGAGGSIGSELCRQVLMLRPKALLLFDVSEFSLYQVQQNLIFLLGSFEKNENECLFVDVPIIPILGSVCNENRLRPE